MRGSQLSANRSSVSMGLKSSIRPPKIVSIVDELGQLLSISQIRSRVCLLRAPKHVVEKAL